MSLGKPIRYLFFAISNWQIETGRGGNPAILPTVIVAILLSLNILVMVQILMLFGMTVPLLRSFPDLARLLGLGCYLIVGGIVWLLLVRDNAYTQFAEEFATTSERLKKMRTVGLYLYISLSFCLPFAVRMIWHNARIH